ncbi:MAG: sigma-70 family RNA polymerase sigma factor [Anaerolineae bacterium]|jgi:RNA polymerase sigma-70 factor (ECF subfamily)|nr:sigma-70 family RNA polymerase sigma factor [Anaerolineae bacterium]MDH7475406.1 sigma-70 family RNA polymerase sigma factor [Anaerolineae bacterium]
MDEKALIAAAQQGDLEAFNRLVLAYQNMTYNLAYRILGDGDAAADATQDAFLSAYRAIGRFRGGSFKAWLLRIVTNACYDQLRVKQRRPTTSLEALLVTDPESGPSFVEAGEKPEEYALRRELNQVIQAGIGTLPADQRITLVLADIQGFNYQEIAEITDVSLGTVKSRLSRARARLRDFLVAQGELLPAQYRLTDNTAGGE